MAPSARNTMAGMRATEIERFWRLIARRDGHWIWTGEMNHGYGRFFGNGRKPRHWLAHRYVYETMIEPIPPGMHVDHLCNVTECVNPAHLALATPAENNARSTSPSALNARKSECLNGHLLEGENVYTPPGTTKRYCRICQQARSHAHYLRGRQ